MPQAVWLLTTLAVFTAGLPFYVQRPLIIWSWTPCAWMSTAPPLWQRSLLCVLHLLALCGWAWLALAWIGSSLASSTLAVFGRVLLMLTVLVILLGGPMCLGRRSPAPAKAAAKSFLSRLLEWLTLYALTLALGFALEAHLGNPFPQSWPFYAITLSLYLIPAFPAFVWRYLLRR